MVDLRGKTSGVYDAAIPRDTRTTHVTIEVTLADGTRQSTTCRKPPGTWGEPIDADQHRAKIRDCLGVRLNASQVERVFDLLDRLEHLKSADIAQLTALLA